MEQYDFCLHLQRYDMLLCVFYILNQNCSIHKDVIEEKELSWFDSISTGFCQNTLSYQHSTCQKKTIMG